MKRDAVKVGVLVVLLALGVVAQNSPTVVIPPPHPFGFNNPRMDYYGEVFVGFQQPQGLRQKPESKFDPQVFHEESYFSRMTLEVTILDKSDENKYPYTVPSSDGCNTTTWLSPTVSSTTLAYCSQK
jgi:hypothetical protein